VGAKTRLELSGYQNRIDHYIFLSPLPPISTVRGAYPAYGYSSTNARLRGLEASFQVDPTQSVSLYASGMTVRGVNRADGTPLFDMPADRLVASARFYGPRGGTIVDPYLELGTTLVREQDHVPSNTVYKLPTDGYALFSLEVGAREISVLGRRMEVGLSARNVFNTRYRDYLSRYRLYVDDTGRDVVLRLRTMFGRTAP
jgi:iron complex outermembrane receptor protein